MFGRPSSVETQILGDLDGIKSLLAKVDAALVVRDPGTARSVEAYDGLRKQVIAAASDRRRLLVMLSELGGALDRGASVDDVRGLVDEWIDKSGLVRVVDVNRARQVFSVPPGTPTGVDLRVVEPAWVDSQTQTVVRQGVAEGAASRPDSGEEPVAEAQASREAEASPSPEGAPAAVSDGPVEPESDQPSEPPEIMEPEAEQTQTDEAVEEQK